jgi:hypothetical protein
MTDFGAHSNSNKLLAETENNVGESLETVQQPCLQMVYAASDILRISLRDPTFTRVVS